MHKNFYNATVVVGVPPLRRTTMRRRHHHRIGPSSYTDSLSLSMPSFRLPYALCVCMCAMIRPSCAYIRRDRRCCCPISARPSAFRPLLLPPLERGALQCRHHRRAMVATERGGGTPSHRSDLLARELSVLTVVRVCVSVGRLEASVC